MLLIPSPARAQEPDHPVLDGIALQRARVAGVALYYDPDVDPEIIATASAAIEAGLTDVPELTGLPPFTTPIRAFILSDDERFRLALAELGNVRVDLVADEIGGYTIERDGTMLVFFAAANVATPASAELGYSHELAHLAVREATQRRALPQWFNEGYASWIATQALARRHPTESALQGQLDRAAVASALSTRGLIPWVDLVSRSRFSRAGVDGLVNLAYGQSTLFIDFLGQRHGKAALARFLTSLGEGTAATPAFASAFGAFGAETAAYEASLTAVTSQLPPGLHVVQRATSDQPAVMVLVGGPALETAVVELWEGSELSRRRELDLDGAGLIVVSLASVLLEDATDLRLRVTVPMLGALELDPVSGTSDSLTTTPAPRPGHTVVPVPLPGPAPVQLPAA
jgi:hypothetical protein